MIEKEFAPAGSSDVDWKQDSGGTRQDDIRIASSTLCWINIRELAHGHKKFGPVIWNSFRVNTNSISLRECMLGGIAGQRP